LTDEFTNLLCETIGEMEKKGHWLEGGEIVVNGKLYSYKLQRLKKKPPVGDKGN